MEKSKNKISFLKRIKMALFELENYIEFTEEKLSKALFFAFKVSVILALISVISSVAYIKIKYGDIDNMANKVIPEFTYIDHKLEFTEDYDKDDSKMAVAYAMKSIEPYYRDTLPDGTYTKQELLQLIRENHNTTVSVSIAIAFFLEQLISTYVWWLVTATLTSFIGLVVLTFSRIKMKYSGIYALSIYASLLTTIITVIYQLLNVYFRVYINLFDYLAVLIAYIYITAAIYMIKSDLIKQQIELIKLATEQAKIKEEMEKEKQREEEEKRKMREEQEEKERKEKENNEDSGNEPELEDKDEEPDEPDGSEI